MPAKLTPSDLALLREGVDGKRIRATVERQGVPDPEGQARNAQLQALADRGFVLTWLVTGKGNPVGEYTFTYILTDAGKRAIG